MSFLEKIRQKPEKTRKKIFLICTIFAVILVLVGFFLTIKYNLSKIDFSNIPKPTFERDYLKEIEEKLKREKEKLNGLEEEIKEENYSTSPSTNSSFQPTVNPTVFSPQE